MMIMVFLVGPIINVHALRSRCNIVVLSRFRGLSFSVHVLEL